MEVSLFYSMDSMENEFQRIVATGLLRRAFAMDYGAGAGS